MKLEPATIPLGTIEAAHEATECMRTRVPIVIFGHTYLVVGVQVQHHPEFKASAELQAVSPMLEKARNEGL